MTLQGRATSEGTARYRERFRGVAAKDTRFEQNLWLSSSASDIPRRPRRGDRQRYAEAIARAVELGANVIDTGGQLPIPAQRARDRRRLKRSSTSGFVREELLICTKGGYIPFDSRLPSGRGGVRATSKRLRANGRRGSG